MCTTTEAEGKFIGKRSVKLASISEFDLSSLHFYFFLLRLMFFRLRAEFFKELL